MKSHTVNSLKGILEFSYIPFDRAYQLAEYFLKFGGSGTMHDLCKLLGLKYKTGWLGLEIKSLRNWKLISGKGKMNLTDRFYKIAESKNPDEKLMIKRAAFLEIPLFKIVFDRYFEKGMPQKKDLSNILESDYNVNPRYSSAVARAILDSISKYFKEFGKNQDAKIEQNPYNLFLRKEVEPSPYNFEKKKYAMHIRVASSLGNFNFDVVNKDGLEKALKVIKSLWKENGDTDENQEEGAHET